MNKVFNVSCRKVGGIWFLKVGRFNVSFSVSAVYRPIGGHAPMPFTIEELQSACRRAGDGSAMVVERDR